MDALEHARLAGESFPGADMIAGELVAVISAQRRRPARASNPQRYVFALFEPFLIDEPIADKQAGRIERASLAPIWLWLLRDLAPASSWRLMRRTSSTRCSPAMPTRRRRSRPRCTRA